MIAIDDSTATGQRKLNCWEFMQCGREPGGRNAAVTGVCPAATEGRLDGGLGGTNGGRCCWIVAGTFCKGEPEGTFAKRYATCRQCDFFKKVQSEEFPILWHAGVLLFYMSSSATEERDRYHHILSHMVDPAVIRYAVDDPSVLEKGEEKHVTAFFSDITGFSELSGALDAPSLGSFLNEYLTAMTEILKAEGGTLDKYIGDGVVGIFGAPMTLANEALSAARASLRMQHRLSQLRSEWRRRGVYGPKAWSLRMRIGLSSGPAKVGFMGTSDFASYTMSGATVNLGKWLEQACKAYRVPILVSEVTRNRIASEMVLRRIDTARPKGRIGTEKLYELLGPIGTIPREVVRAAEIYEAALDLHDRGHWNAAAKLLRRAEQQRATPDQAADRLLRRCERLGGDSRGEHRLSLAGEEPECRSARSKPRRGRTEP